MRLYDIEIGGGKSYSSRGNPNALNVELDIMGADADKFISGTIVVWGVSLDDISQATDLANKSITVTAGMQQGLPFANAQAAEAGVIAKGYVYESFGNWVGTEMWLTLVIMPGTAPNPPAAPNAPNPPPKNLTLNWLKGKTLSDALKQTLSTGMPELTPNINISDKLVAPQDNIHYAANFRELNNYVRATSQQIMQGNTTYPGVGICIQNDEITVHDGTSPPSPIEIAFIDLVGQPTWIAFGVVQVKTVMRGDLKISGQFTLPPTRVVSTAAAQEGLSTPLTFSGTFTIQSLRHVGNFRQPDGAAWVTIIEGLKQ